MKRGYMLFFTFCFSLLAFSWFSQPVIEYWDSAAGIKKSEINYLNGMQNGAFHRWYKDGKKNGAWKTWNENGKLISSTPYVNDRKEGNWVFYYDNGSTQSSATFVRD